MIMLTDHGNGLPGQQMKWIGLAQTPQRIATGWPNAELDQLLPFNHHAG